MSRCRRVCALIALSLFVLSAASPCHAQSATRGSGTIIQGQPVFQGSTTQGGTIQGSTTFGSTTQGSTSKGSTTFGSTTQGSTTQGSTTQGSATMSRETFESKFWKYLKSSRYTQWAPVPGKTGDAYAGESPHGAMLKMYLNRTAAGLSLIHI